MPAITDESEETESEEKKQGKGNWVEIVKEILKKLPMNKLTAGMVFAVLSIILMGIFIPRLYPVSPDICIIFMIMVFVYSILFIYIEYRKTVPTVKK